ncbi:YfiR/HmsC family protein [Haliea sp. E17]|uniref:hybrid sensor histidine kinase/response regulator n=1 Tax=Haliea sp. E17 TaxID=3401576 RepID=UPI003AADEDC9
MAQETVSVEDGKVSLLQAILANTTWPDERQIDPFVIGLYGRDRALLIALRKKAPQLSVRGKPVVVIQYDSVKNARAAHVLVLSKSKSADLVDIDRELHQSNTLIVTDSSDDQSHIMVNFTHPTDQRLSFEINRSNIVYAGLQLSKDILLFGGTELDAATIYRETEAELVRAKAIATQQLQQLEAQKQLLAKQESTIEAQRREMSANSAELTRLEQQLTGVQSTLQENTQRLRESESRLGENATALAEKERILAEKEAHIESYSARINQNLQRLEEQQAEIESQERRIAEQSTVLAKQVSTIEHQQLILSAAIAALLLVLTLIVIIFRGYRSKHRMARKLEGKTRELEVLNERLQQVTEAKSRFLSTMSHEIRTPMNGVIGMAELLEGTDLTGQQREYVSLIIKSADTLLGLINNILDFSKIEAGGLELEAIPFNVRDILGDTLQSMGLRAAEKGLELTFHIPPEVPEHLIGDPLRLRQIIVNLVGNAIKFTESGEVAVDLQLESHDAVTARVVFEVRDTGLGISAQQQQKIFEAFGQADSSTTRQYGGTGLGLAIAAQLAEKMGSKMEVTSDIGLGSTFSFTVDFQLPQGPVAERLHPSSLRAKRALVVDDNSTNRAILQELLSNWGMLVSVVDSGEAALAELARAERDGHKFVIGLLDVMMPHMDGFELAGKIREQAGQADMRILMLTSAGRSNQEALRARLDISRILLKPVKHSDLLVAITDALGVTRAAPRTQVPGGRPEGLVARRVLLVEDNPVNQKVARDLLTRRGHIVELAQNGREAVAALSQGAFDVVLMDVHMPVMDGLTATRTIRERERGTEAHVPIIAMTAGATTEDREQCFAAGMDDFVTKPFRAVELNRAVESVLPGRQGAESAAAAHQAERELPGAGAGAAVSGAAALALPATGRDASREGAACLDWQGALEKLEGDEALLLELAEMFLDQCPALLATIEEAIAGEAAEALRLSAHTLKGSAQVIGGRATGAAALVLENLGRENKLGAAPAALDELKERLAELEQALASMRDRAPVTDGD